jgi:hypothetical protein
MWRLDTVWTFARGDERLQLRHGKTEEGLLLIEHHDDLPERSFFFQDLPPLLLFEKELIARLQQTGWTIIEFSPDRRTSAERRRETGRRGHDRRGTFHPRPS